MYKENKEFDSNYLTHIYFKAKRKLKSEEGSVIAENINALPGIEEFALLPDKIVITYYSYLITGDYIKETLFDSGYPMAETDRKRKSPLQRFLERISESNKKVFASDSLPACCKPGS